MAQLQRFALVGDSNLRRHMSPTNISGRPIYSDAQVLSCGKLSLLSSTLESVRADADVCVIACITNFITNSVTPVSSVSLRLDAVLPSFFDKVFSFCRSRRDLPVFVCPPMYRTTPVWYREGLSEVMLKFSSTLRGKANIPSNLCLLSSFAKPQLEVDGVHLNPYSGLQNIVYLFEAPQEAFSRSFLAPELKVGQLSEDHRALEDRVAVLEQDNVRLSRKFDLETAVRAEFDDFQENIANEPFFMIQGLAALTKLDPKEWQVRAQADVNRVLSEMGFTEKVDYVQNLTGHGKNARVLYKCRVKTAESSRDIRNKFSSFFKGGQDTRPPSLSSLSVRNCVTQATLGRIAIMQLLAKRYKESNPGSRVQVINYEPRPLLKITPPSGVSDRRVQTFNFIDAVTKLPTAFAPDEIDGLLKRISNRLHPRLKELFVVLSPDMVPRVKNVSRKKKDGPTSTPVASGSDTSPFRTPDGGRKRGSSTPTSGPASKK